MRATLGITRDSFLGGGDLGCLHAQVTIKSELYVRLPV